MADPQPQPGGDAGDAAPPPPGGAAPPAGVRISLVHRAAAPGEPATYHDYYGIAEHDPWSGTLRGHTLGPSRREQPSRRRASHARGTAARRPGGPRRPEGVSGDGATPQCPPLDFVGDPLRASRPYGTGASSVAIRRRSGGAARRRDRGRRHLRGLAGRRLPSDGAGEDPHLGRDGEPVGWHPGRGHDFSGPTTMTTRGPR